MEKNDLYSKLIMVFGKENQVIVAVEELAELQKELTKFLRKKLNRVNLSEEIADVEIMVEQLKLMFNCGQQVEDIKNYKLERTARDILGVKNVAGK